MCIICIIQYISYIENITININIIIHNYHTLSVYDNLSYAHLKYVRLVYDKYFFVDAIHICAYLKRKKISFYTHFNNINNTQV